MSEKINRITYKSLFLICFTVKESIRVEDHGASPVRHHDDVPEDGHANISTLSLVLDIKRYKEDHCFREAKTDDLRIKNGLLIQI